MDFEQAMGIEKGQEGRRASWPDRLAFIRLVKGRLMRFRAACGWDDWFASVEDLEASDWLVSEPARLTDA